MGVEAKQFDGDISVGRNAAIGGDAKVVGGMTVGRSLKVDGWLEAKNIKDTNKGLFVDLFSLKKAYPVPQDGWWALVGTTLPANVYVAKDGDWVYSGGTGGEITVESQQIEALIERFEEEMQSMRDVNETQTNNIVALSNATNTNAAEIEAVKSKNAEQDELLAASVAADAAHDEEISALKNKDTTHDSRIEKLEERVLQYIYPKLYQLNEGAGALKFNGFTEAEGSGGLLLTKDTYRYSVLYSTTQNAFILNVTDEASGQGVRVGTFSAWPKIEGKGIASSEGYAQRDCLYYIFVSGEGSTYYYINEEGDAVEASATYLLRLLLDKNATEAKAADAAQVTRLDSMEVKVKELGGYANYTALFARAAKFDIVSNEDIAILHGTYFQASGVNHGVLILQQVEKNNNGGGTAMQYIYIEKRQYTRYIDFSATAVTGVQSVQNHGARNLSLSNRVLQLKNMWDKNVGSGVTLPDNGNLYEGTAGTTTVPVVMAKTFGGIVSATLGAATSARAGVMTASDKSKLDNMVREIPWTGYHMNMFTERGEYHLYGERTDASDGLPIINAAEGHTIDARLTVLDSSLTNGTGASTDVCVTQVLRLNNRTGGDGHVFVRTGQAATKSSLASASSAYWSTWEKLMGVFEKNAVSSAESLDAYKSNGVYSGMFVFSNSPSGTVGGLSIESGSTFLLVVVNGYAVASTGLLPQVTQLLYLLPSGGLGQDGVRQANMYVRTAIFNASSQSYVWGNFDKIATAGDISVVVAGLSDAVVAISENSNSIAVVRKTAQDNAAEIEAVKSKNQEQDGRLDDHDRSISSASGTANTALNKANENSTRIEALENPPAPDYVEMIIEAETSKHYRLFYDVRCIGWLEIDGAEVELPVITEDRAASYYAALSPGRHVVRFRPKEGNMSDGTPWKERTGMLGWCSGNQVTEVTLPEGWTVINTKMFEGAESLRRVNLPSTITEVRYGAFGNCAALEEIVLPASVERIEHIIAHDCPALKRIVLGGRNISAYGTLAQSCAALECVEFRAGGTVAFTSSNNTFVNLPQLARFIVKGNLPTFECSQPFTSTGYVGSSVEADKRWLFTSDGETPSGTKWQTSLMSQCGFTVKKEFSYTLL